MEPESREIDLYKKRKNELEDEIKEAQTAIREYERAIEEKCEEIDMLDYLINKLKERIGEEEQLR